MTFQFACPQGHLLEGEPSQAGQQCQCPVCGVMFIIPQPEVSPQAEVVPPQFGIAPPQPDLPQQDPMQPAASPAMPELGKKFEELASGESSIYHIPCPNGHMLESPPDMIGQTVMCPHCGAQFKLTKSRSVEDKQRRQEESERKERESGKRWFTAAIVVGILVLLLIVVLIAINAQ